MKKWRKTKKNGVLIFVVYTLIYNYVCIDYLSCQSKTLSAISCNPAFKNTSFNMLSGIGIKELLLNLVSCHGFTKKQNSTVIFNCQTCLVTNYLSKGFSIIEQNTENFILLQNDVKLRTNLTYQLDTDYVMVKNKEISAVENIIKKLYIQKICM